MGGSYPVDHSFHLESTLSDWSESASVFVQRENFPTRSLSVTKPDAAGPTVNYEVLSSMPLLLLLLLLFQNTVKDVAA